MSFDPRSLERLKELGRSLPEPIAPPQQNKGRPVKATEKRHRIETEDNPERLFQELMKASSDGTVPEHLMARLKEAERHVATQNKAKAKSQAQALTSSQPLSRQPLRGGQGKTTRPSRPKVAAGSEEESLYVAFGQLLLEDDEDCV
jgi:type IV secretory pathway VirB10-like protein